MSGSEPSGDASSAPGEGDAAAEIARLLDETSRARASLEALRESVAALRRSLPSTASVPHAGAPPTQPPAPAAG